MPPTERRTFRMGIRLRALLTFAAIVVLGIGALETINLFGLPSLGIRGSLPQAREQALQRLSDAADDRHSLLTQWLADRRHHLALLADNSTVRRQALLLGDLLAEQAQRGDVPDAFWQAYRQRPEYRQLKQELLAFGNYVLDVYAGAGFIDAASGQVIIGRLDDTPFNLAGNALFEAARQPGQSERIDAAPHPRTGQPIVTLTRQMFDTPGREPSGTLRAFAYLVIDPAAIPLGEARPESGRTRQILLIDPAQNLLATTAAPDVAPSASLPRASRLESRIAELAANGSEGLIATKDHRGVPVLAAFRHIPISAGRGWGIIVQQDEAEALALIYARLWQRLLVALAVLSCMLFAVGWLTQKIAAPIISLAKTARALENGNLAARSVVVRNDEIGLLAHAFNAMADRVASWHDALSHQVTERTRQLVRSNQLYQLLGQSNQAIIQCRNDQDLYTHLCRDAVEIGGMVMAWVGVLEPDTWRVRPVASFGDTTGYLDGIEVSAQADSPQGQGPLGRAIRENQPVWCQDYWQDASIAPWDGRTPEHRWKSMAVLPLRRQGQVIGAMLFYAAEIRAFDVPVQELLREIADDVSFAIDHYAGEAAQAQVEYRLRQNEARFHGIFNRVEDGIVIAELDSGRIDSANPAFLRMIGYTLGELTHLRVVDLHPPEAHSQAHESFARLGRGQNIRIENIPLLRQDGTLFNAEIVASIIDMENRRLVCGVVRDTSERLRISRELERHRDQLEQRVRERTAELSTALEAARVADRTKDAFLANISHELRTPLNAIMGFAQLAHAAGSDPRQRDYLAKITVAARSLSEIINDLLDLSKIAAGRLEFESLPFSLRNLVERCQSLISTQAEAKKLQLTCRVDDEVPDALRGDPHRLEQLLLNLLSNAVKYTPAGHVDLHITVKASETQRVCLLAAVEDTGIGISAEELSRLFQPFSQADASITRQYGGTGLGLTICKRLAEMMDGDIHVTSRKGEGSTFSAEIWLPLADKPAFALPEPVIPEATAHYRDTRVLVVEDQPINRMIVEELLQEMGIEVVLAENGQDALQILDRLAADAFDLVFMDLQMPVMDGLTTTRKIREQPAHARLPIIALTAHTMQHEKEAALAAGMNDHLSKPFEVQAMRRILARWIAPAKQNRATITVAAGSSADDLPRIAGLDSTSGLAYFAGKEGRYRYWLACFAEQGERDVALLCEEIAAGERIAACERAHALKGRLGMLGMRELHAIAGELNTALLAKEADPASTASLADQLRQAVATMCQSLKTALDLPVSDNPQTPEADRPVGEPPDCLPAALRLLAACDGASADAIAGCLAETSDPAWSARLQTALNHAQCFDYAAAMRVLSVGEPSSTDNA